MFRVAILTAALFAALLPAAAQWVHYPSPGLPRAADGKPNLTAPAPKTADGKPDLSGIWHVRDRKYLFDLATDVGQAPFQPWAAALYKERLANNGKDRPSGRCLPHTLTDAPLVGTTVFKILQTPGVTAVLYEEMNHYRQIFTDGRALPPPTTGAWFGYSVGHWEGDALVVDTTGFHDRSWLDDPGHPHTDALHVTERYRRLDSGHLQIQFTIDDPKTYTKPWSVTVPFELAADTELIENICENEKDQEHIVR
jgi:hypothetical protein